MDNEVGQFALLHWKKKLGIVLTSEEERDYQRWLLAYEQSINWEKIDAQMLMEAEVRSFKKNTVKQFEEAFEAKYGLPMTRAGKIRPILYHFRRVAVILIAYALVAVLQSLSDKKGGNGQALGQIPKADKVNLSRDSGIVLENSIHCRIPLTITKSNQVITREGAVTTRLSNDSLYYEVTDWTDETDTGYNTIIVPAGKQLRVILPDKSSICVNSNSSIRIPLRFGRSKRVIAMSGDCFFRVMPNTAMPFTVVTETMTIQSTGTFFNVDTRSLFLYQVTLMSGQMSVINGSLPVYLNEGDIYQVINGREKVIRDHRAHAETVARREDREFNFKSIKLWKLIEEIAQWYGLVIKDPSSLNLPYDMQFESVSKQDPVEKILRAIERHNKVKFSLNGDTLSVQPFQ